jgi:hypothetical protein
MVKKRYHQSKRDRMHERMGEERHMKRMKMDRMHESEGMEHYMHHKDRHNDEKHSGGRDHMMRNYREGYYEGPEMRRHQEMMDGGMIREDHSKIANLPQDVMIKPYPMTGPYVPEGLDDTIRGVDRQMDSDDSKRAEHFFPHKY